MIFIIISVNIVSFLSITIPSALSSLFSYFSIHLTLFNKWHSLNGI
ncbi:hypothetical protein NEISICOT_00082 [Neisseria sicca ATCC 29256]|uniref:Uncharacterized protein n=1 Tax=Neisseria sicca ATCC 29256 TaxID=547045 RepID=C6M0Q7_NEISI|nr:hypothetical protein NEISICOT_00082 [Neisseria sicca ATCC 29256]